MGLLETLNWRYAAKSMTGDRVPADKLHRILEATRLAPSSSGLQPYKVLVVSSQELKEKIRPAAFNQPQVTECSDLLIFAAWDHYTPERINELFDRTNKERGSTNEGFEAYRKMLLDTYTVRTPDVNFEHAARQAYIGLGIAIAAAAEEQIDSTPMEGFDSKAVDEILNLKKEGLRSVVLLPLGYRNTNTDWLVNLKKVRRSFEQFVTKVG